MIKDMTELIAKKEEAFAKMTSSKSGEPLTRIVVGMATCGIAAGATPVYDIIKKTIKKLGIKNISLVQTGCIGMCQFEPIVEITAPGKKKVTYVLMDAKKAEEVVREHLVNNNPLAEYTVSAVTK